MSENFYTVMLDGAFVSRKLKPMRRKAGLADHDCPKAIAKDLSKYCDLLHAHPCANDLHLLRRYFYDCEPLKSSVNNPVGGAKFNFKNTPLYRFQVNFLDAIKNMDDFSLRLGELSKPQWLLPKQLQRQAASGLEIFADDLKPVPQQKGVDLRIGLDMARVALCKQARTIVLITGDSDLLPAMKFVRREGVRLIIDTMQHGVLRGMHEHSDVWLGDKIANQHINYLKKLSSRSTRSN